MKISEKYAMLIAILADIPAMYWGPPGQGKSSFVRKSLPPLGFGVRTIRMNTILPHQLSGSMIPNKEGTGVTLVPPDWALQMNSSFPKWILFMDDLSCATPSQQQAGLGLMDEREIGGVKMNYIPIAAANPAQDATARFDLDGAAANRCLHISIHDDGKSFAEEIRNDFAAPEMPVLRPNWEQVVKVKAELVAKFLESPEGSAVINAMPSKITPQSAAWPSKRTWKYLWTLMAICDSIDPTSVVGCTMTDVRTILFHGAVGKGAYEKFKNYFLKPMDGDAEIALEQGKKFRMPESGDEVFSLIFAVSQRLAAQELTQPRWKQAWAFVEHVWATRNRDMVIPLIQDLVTANAKFPLPELYTATIRPILQTNV